MNRYRKSQEYLERAKRLTPGAAQTLSKSYKRFPNGAFPVACVGGHGARLTDVDGNVYVDWIGALGAVPLGYTNDYLHAGAAYSLPHESEATLAERVCSKIPCAEMVRFVNFRE